MKPTTIQYRDARISRRGIDEHARTAELSFASPDPYERSFGIEILDCTSTAVNLSRLNNGGNLLVDHDVKDVVGVVERAWCDGGKARALVRFGKGARASEVWSDVSEGIRSNVSVGYQVDELQESGKQGGQKVFRATRWTPLEISIVSVPADATVGIGRSANHPMNTTTTPENKHDDNAIRELAATLKKQAGFASSLPFDLEVEAERCIARGLSTKDFQKHCVDAMSPEPFRVAASDTAGTSGSYHARRSFGDNTRSIGATILADQEFQRFVRQGGQKYVSMDIPGIANVRTALTLSGTTLSNVDQTQTIIPFTVERLTIADLFSQGTTTGSSVRFATETGFENTSSAVAESATKPEISLELSPTDAPVKKLAGYVRCSQELIEDVTAAQSFIDMRLRFAIEEREEQQLLSGSGAGANLLGLLNVSGIGSQAYSNSPADTIRKGMTTVRIASKMPATAVVLHPTDLENLQLAKDANGQYLVGNIFAQNEMGQLVRTPSIFGLPIVETTAATAGAAIIGAFKPCAWLWRRSGVSLSASREEGTNFITNMITILAEERLASGIVIPSGFVVADVSA
ncbi:MAG: phage major capsid protein [Pyrinomonadaceae bacterium]|nr:phage major capsid protein [Chthoniobacterales bacterium]MBA3570550.1 phage major capsid protein [Pyrinomonadaceae bacterium]